jgi:hypothetical protein
MKALLFPMVLLPALAHAGPLAPCDRLYGEVVVEGAVDYGKVAAHPDRDACLQAIGTATVPAEKPAALAFWADAYNLLSILAIADDPQRWSPQQDGKILFRDRSFTVGGVKMTLDELEKRHLVGAPGNDPRLEFLLSCGSRSCALLPGKLLSAGGGKNGLDAAIEEGMKRWFARPDNLRVNKATASVEIGQLLQADWHGQDFEKAGTPVEELIAKALEQRNVPGDRAAAAELRAGRYKLTIRPYDWRLNRRRSVLLLP